MQNYIEQRTKKRRKSIIEQKYGRLFAVEVPLFNSRCGILIVILSGAMNAVIETGYSYPKSEKGSLTAVCLGAFPLVFYSYPISIHAPREGSDSRFRGINPVLRVLGQIIQANFHLFANFIGVCLDFSLILVNFSACSGATLSVILCMLPIRTYTIKVSSAS